MSEGTQTPPRAPQERPRRRRWKLRLPQGDTRRQLVTHVTVGAAAFTLAWAIVALVIFPDDSLPRDVVIPSVVGLPLSDAQARLRDAGLDHALGERRPSTTVPRSTVLAQDPAAGGAAQRGDRVTLDVSAGQRPVTIPRLVGMGRADAERALRRAGLELGDVDERPGAEARGTVLEAEPRPGQVVPEGSAIDLVVSAGPAELLMPDVVGRSAAEARGTLEQLGLVVGTVDTDSASTLPSGVVLSQIPAAGAAVAPGTSVFLRVSGRP